MSSSQVLEEWVLEALHRLGGGAHYIIIAKYIWDHHENDLRKSGDLFYRWQYDMRWAAKVLRLQGKLKQAAESPRGIWELS